jgi:pilin isopeptide linkage protein
LTAQKYLGNDVAEPGSFSFELFDQDGNVLQTAVVSDGGAVEFEPIEYTINDIGLHHYVIRETDPNDENIMYDNHECRVTVNITGEQELSIKYSKTPNISTSGERLSPYSYTQNQIDVVRIPGADRLHVSITYATYNGYQDYACMWLGNCSGYSTLDDVAVSITGKLGDGSMAYLRTKEYDVPGDTVTFGFHGHITSTPDYAYGYYAVVTGIRLPQAEVSYDGDRVFHNEYAPGSLVLTKMFDGDVQTDDPFWYEVQFLQESGMTYELEDAEVTYETRSGSEYDYPDLHPFGN